MNHLRAAWPLLVSMMLFAGILVPRALALDRLVTPDEPTWLTTSANFYEALARGDLRQTYQIEHPGVTTMWIGTLGYLWQYPAYAQEGPGQIAWWEEEVGPYLQARGRHPLEILRASRLVMALVITLVLGAAFLFARRLFGLATAGLGFLLIATDPFHAAHSRLLHQDGLLSSLMLLSLLGLLSYLYRGRRPADLLVSAAAAGFAWLTKSPTLFLVPFAGLLVAAALPWQALRREPRTALSKDLRWGVSTFLLWGAAGLAVFVLFWPAMWVDPLFTLWRVLRAMVGYAAAGHEAPVFYNGAIVDGDPGIAFYPVSYLWRSTPAVLVGLALLLAAAAVPRWAKIAREHQRPLLALLLFAALFTLFMSLGAKKFDRYLLPIYPPLSLVSAAGWMVLFRWLTARRSVIRYGLALVLALSIAIAQAQHLVGSHPYYLTYYNPWLGGPPRAVSVMMVGWGEGLDEAARYLNSLPGDPRVGTGVWNGTISYFLDAPPEGSLLALNSRFAQRWAACDYYVVYVNQWQRGRLPPELLHTLDALSPVKVVRLQGVEYARIYDIRGVPPPSYTDQ